MNRSATQHLPSEFSLVLRRGGAEASAVATQEFAAAIRERFPGNVGEGNVAAAERAYELARERSEELTRA